MIGERSGTETKLRPDGEFAIQLKSLYGAPPSLKVPDETYLRVVQVYRAKQNVDQFLGDSQIKNLVSEIFDQNSDWISAENKVSEKVTPKKLSQ
ncbi:MAG: hypothetical protein A4S09_16220 [Proteobacteria bacterium SG_bin7]|nr:MAG: hypothetical protein A4S09_16220 [Proteobacteria bacterium SG_bin7]